MRRIWPFKTKALVQTDDELLAIISGESGAGVDPLTVPAVSAAVKTISESAATLDLNLVRRNDFASKENHPALDLLHGQVNDWTSGFQLIRDLLIEAMLRDQGGMAWVNRVADKPVEIVHYRVGAISYQEEETRELLYRLSGRPVPASDIIHVRAPFGKAPVTLAKRAIQAAAAMERHAERLWNNGARPGGAIEIPAGVGEDAIKRIRSGWRAAHEGGGNAGKTAILHGGAKFTPFTMTSTDAQFIENRRWQLEDIARAFNMSPVMLGDLTKSSYANAWQKNREFLGITLSPWLRIVEAALNRALLTTDERSRLTFMFDIDDLSRVDLEKRATAISSLISSRVLAPNEARVWLDAGLAPYEGGDAFANPHTGASQPGSEPSIRDGDSRHGRNEQGDDDDSE